MAKAETVEIMFDGVLMECTREEDRGGEHLFVAPNGRFIKFPVDVDLEEAISTHNEVNKHIIEATPDVIGDFITFDKDGNEVPK